jgi:hypothetical protein
LFSSVLLGTPNKVSFLISYRPILGVTL